MTVVRGTLLAALMAASLQASAQPGPPDPRAIERIERLRKVRLIEVLDLKEEQSVRFFARLNEFDGRRKELRKEKGEILDRIERLIRNRADDRELEKAFAEVDAVEGKMAEEHRKFAGGLGDILTVEQRGRFLLFERHFDRELKDAIMDAARRRRGAGEPQPHE